MSKPVMIQHDADACGHWHRLIPGEVFECLATGERFELGAEPLHESMDDAISWVKNNRSQDSIWIDWTRQEVVRIAKGDVLILKESTNHFGDHKFFWESLRQDV